MKIEKILIAVDSSEFSLVAARKGLALAHQLNAKVALVFVIDRALETGNIDVGIFPNDVKVMLKKEAIQTLDGLANMYNENDIIKLMPEGKPYEDIIKSAANFEADLIVMGTHGSTGILGILMGSVTEKVIKHSKIPVMVVPSA